MAMYNNINNIPGLCRCHDSYAYFSQAWAWASRVQCILTGKASGASRWTGVSFSNLLHINGRVVCWLVYTYGSGCWRSGRCFRSSSFQKEPCWKGFNKSLFDATIAPAMIMLLITGAMVFGRLMAISPLPFEMAQIAGSLPPVPICCNAVDTAYLPGIGLFYWCTGDSSADYTNILSNSGEHTGLWPHLVRCSYCIDSGYGCNYASGGYECVYY